MSARFLVGFLFGCLAIVQVWAQKQNVQWALNGSLIRFNADNSVSFLPNQGPSLGSAEGLASVCDPKTGRLLFATNGVEVFDSTFQIMPNGNGLLGGPTKSSTQGAIIIPKPNDADNYYIFTTDEMEAGGYRQKPTFSEVDMALNDGKGDVVPSVKNKELFWAWFSTEKITATAIPDGSGYWVLTHQLNNERFCAFKVTAAGVDTTPVYSDIGGVHLEQGQFSTSRGCMKFSPNGKYLAVAFSVGLTFELFKFDPCTGILSDAISLIGPTVDNPFFNTYGVAFSPDSRKVFFSNLGIDQELQQLDITSWNASDILNSRKSLYLGTDFRTTFGSLQLAPNGKIYLTINGAEYLGVINNPNDTGVNCNFQLRGLPTPGYVGALGLPQDVPNFVDTSIFNRNYSISASDSCFGALTQFELSGNISNINRIVWHFGDLKSGNLNSAQGISPRHRFTAPGTYTVEVTIVSDCGARALSPFTFVVVRCQNNCRASISYTDTCFGVVTQLGLESPEFPNNIQWDFGDTISSNNTQNGSFVSHRFTSKGKYLVTALFNNSCGPIQLVQEINIIDCDVLNCKVQFPNIITPNGDGYNEGFKPFFGCDFSDYQLKLFNRWGLELFSTNDLNEPFPKLKSGTYFYQCTYQLRGEGPKTYTSFIEVVETD